MEILKNYIEKLKLPHSPAKGPSGGERGVGDWS